MVIRVGGLWKLTEQIRKCYRLVVNHILKRLPTEKTYRQTVEFACVFFKQKYVNSGSVAASSRTDTIDIYIT